MPPILHTAVNWNRTVRKAFVSKLRALRINTERFAKSCLAEHFRGLAKALILDQASIAGHTRKVTVEHQSVQVLTKNSAGSLCRRSTSLTG